MKLLIKILLFAWASHLNAQTYWSSREYSIPGLGSRNTDIGVRYSSVNDLDTTMLSYGSGKELNKNMGSSFNAAIGGTSVPGVDTFINFELGGDLTPKYEFALESGAKIVPYARVGVTGNLFSNYSRTVVAEDFLYEYYYTSGDMYFDVYGNYSAGLSYVGVDNKWAVSSEIGKYQTLFGDLDFDYDTSFWTSQVYFKVGANSEIKILYSVEAESKMKTVGLFWSKSF